MNIYNCIKFYCEHGEIFKKTNEKTIIKYLEFFTVASPAKFASKFLLLKF